MVAKPPGERLIRINISLTPEQLQKIDQRVTSDRSALIRSIVQDWLNRQEKKITSPENLRDNFGLDIATEADFEITFNRSWNFYRNSARKFDNFEIRNPIWSWENYFITIIQHYLSNVI